MLLLAVAAVFAAAGCTSWLVPQAIDVPQARLQEALGRRFPIVRRLAEGIEVTVAVPRLVLLPELDRVAIELTMSGGEGLLKQPLAGVALASCGLVFDAASQSVRPVDVRIERLHFDGLPSALERGIERLARPVAERWLGEQTIYALRPRDVERLSAAGVVPGAIRVTPAGISIALVPRSIAATRAANIRGFA